MYVQGDEVLLLIFFLFFARTHYFILLKRVVGEVLDTFKMLFSVIFTLL